LQSFTVITFPLRRSRGEMYIDHTRLCMSVSRHISTLLHGSGCNLEEWWRYCPLVVHYWADLQSVHRFRCYDNVALNTKCQRVLVLAVCLVMFLFVMYCDMILFYLRSSVALTLLLIVTCCATVTAVSADRLQFSSERFCRQRQQPAARCCQPSRCRSCP